MKKLMMVLIEIVVMPQTVKKEEAVDMIQDRKETWKVLVLIRKETKTLGVQNSKDSVFFQFYTSF